MKCVWLRKKYGKKYGKKYEKKGNRIQILNAYPNYEFFLHFMSSKCLCEFQAF